MMVKKKNVKLKTKIDVEPFYYKIMVETKAIRPTWEGCFSTNHVSQLWSKGKNLISTQIFSRTTFPDPMEYFNHINVAISGFKNRGFYILMLINEK